MEFEARASSPAPPERVFALLEAGDRWQEWAGPLVPRSSWQVPGEPVGGVGAVRRLGLGPLASRERVVEHQPPHRLGYVVDSRAPYRDYRSTVELAARADGGTDIAWRSSFEPIVPGTGRVLRGLLRLVVASFARNLAKRA
ncbi:MAG TPA: SRPBCC family protein [Mycobacteriales bacterium]|nr:SRPBCC family protein [Mycobacteriales bacterium]